MAFKKAHFGYLAKNVKKIQLFTEIIQPVTGFLGV